MQTLSKTQRKALNYQLVLNSINGDCYGVELTTDKDKIDFLFKTFESEYGFFINRLGYIKAFEDWINGAPSSFNIPIYNKDRIDFIDKLGLINPESTPRSKEIRIDFLLDNFTGAIADYAMQLKTKLATKEYLSKVYQVND